MDGTYDYRECIGLKVKPQRGDGLLFYSLFPNGTIDAVSVLPFTIILSSSKLTVKIKLYFATYTYLILAVTINLRVGKQKPLIEKLTDRLIKQ